MSLEYFNGGCGIFICPETKPHTHIRCDECGAQDYSGRCLTCLTLRRVYIAGLAHVWADEPEGTQ